MWLGSKALERIRELEARLDGSVTCVVYESALERIRDLERRVDWQADMLLRRGQSMPLPPVNGEPKVEKPARTVTDTDIAKAEAIRAEGQRVGASRDEIADAIATQVGWTERDLAEAIAK